MFKNRPDHAFIFGSNKPPVYDHLVKTVAVTKIFYELPTYENLKRLLYPYKDTTGSLILMDDCLQGLM